MGQSFKQLRLWKGPLLGGTHVPQLNGSGFNFIFADDSGIADTQGIGLP